MTIRSHSLPVSLTPVLLGSLLLGALSAACGDDDDDGSGAAGRASAGNGGQTAGSSGRATGGSSGSSGRAGSSAGAGKGAGSGAGAGGGDADAGPQPTAADFSFFVSSQTNATGDLAGLKGADARCAALAQTVGVGQHTWHAYLSAEHAGVGDDATAGDPVNARDRIGNGPWYNAKGVKLANDLASLHMLKGDAELFIDEHGAKIPGQWTGSPKPVEHDILTGSNPDGTLYVGRTCADWTSASADLIAVVGHSDGLGPNQAATGMYLSWNSSHDNMNCSDTVPRGGAGRIYCFASE